MTTIVWFRRDLRLADNPALFEAARRGPVVPLFILEDDEDDPHRLGGASRWWLHHSLAVLAKSLGGLTLIRGDPAEILPRVAAETGAGAIVWNRLYEPRAVARDTDLKSALRESGLTVESFNASLLAEPWEVETKTGGPFKVYTPFWKALSAHDIARPMPAPEKLDVVLAKSGDTLADWALLPTKPDWAAGWTDIWQPGEAGAIARFEDFIVDGLQGYATLRDRPDRENVSRLSPHLHFGEISPRQLYARIRFASGADPALARDGEKFLAELGWRDFSHHLLWHFPTLPDENWKPAFDAYPWRESAEDLAAWQQGSTGYPLVDAGMRELWQTGYMHNRVRMVAASFLVKHLRLHWKHGEAWFRDTLVDADLANNAASWQWVAGSGADAAPYFRIFNPTSQGWKFDPDGAYVRRWCPELTKLDVKDIHAPCEAAPMDLMRAGVRLGETYPAPIVDHAKARAAALAGYEAVKEAGAASRG
ncbi:MAG: deoxyribodipyrimidine photolyase [Hyphomicrobiales bacterium]|nr:MAG: deoxyribodipyrimidine photolyase [Hyphomicrobiales bacterium]